MIKRSQFNPLALTLAGAVSAAALMMNASPAEACGCFAPPDPSVPIVQAGERLVFDYKDGKVTAHIQIQYQGEANDFGWLLPLPSVPEMTLGSEELFAQLITQTQPKYRLNRQFAGECGNNFPGRGVSLSGQNDSAAPSESDDGSPLVIQDSVGPYDFAVLRADSRDEMFAWLTENNYFIPTGTEDVVGPYIRPGAYFLALKLQKGEAAGDIQPVVLEYESDKPMIPIILTSVAANPDMGIQVWVMGESRAIPFNYRHTVLNDEHIDWFNAGENYNDVIIAATNEAKEGQSFVTEFAGPSDSMRNVLDWDGRFGVQAELEKLTDAGEFVSYLQGHGYNFQGPIVGMLLNEFPLPQFLADQGVDEDAWVQSMAYYLGYYREDNPEHFEGYDLEFDPVDLTGKIWERIVTPTLAAGKLFSDDNPMMTRLYTTLSPNEMTADPVFSFNPDLPDINNTHEATFAVLCNAEPVNGQLPGVLELPDGRRFYVTDQAEWAARERVGVPFSSRIELLREEGAPIVEIDNQSELSPGDADSGCACSAPVENNGTNYGFASFLALGLAGLFLARRRK